MNASDQDALILSMKEKGLITGPEFLLLPADSASRLLWLETNSHAPSFMTAYRAWLKDKSK